MSSFTDTLTRHDIHIEMPNMYSVIIHNDHITTMEFVVHVLTDIFQKSPPEAAALMMDVHNKGQGVAGVYVFDIAATKKSQADKLASQHGFPLKLTLREVQG